VSRARSPEDEALDRLVTELRELPAPELDWDRMEARVLNEPRTSSSPMAPGLFGRLRLPAAAIVALATGVFLFAPRRASLPPAQSQPVAQLPAGPLDGDHLALGTRVSAGKQNVQVEHAGRARWTLEPYGAASVINAGELLTVRLDSGALSANVVPQPKPETFAVEVGGTRVAVHGTAFRVERVGDRVLVEVSEGIVAVEPTSNHSVPSFLLRRGSRGNFGLDGRTGSVEGNASVVVHEGGPKSRREIRRAAAPHVSPPIASAAPAPTADAQKPAEPPVVALPVQASPQQPSISDIEAGVSSALELMNRCFQQTHSSDIHVSVSTGMTLSVAGDGTVQSVTFAPPLAPAVEDCGVLGLRNLTFARSVEGATFTRILELTR